MSALFPAAVFSSRMVLQRGKPINIWGEELAHRSITIKFMVNTVYAQPEKNRWKAVLPPANEYGGPYSMEISDGVETKVFDDIMIGEVWLAGGQSNMELELRNCLGGAEELKISAESNVRFYYTNKNPFMDEKFYLEEHNTCWNTASEENSKYWSAVGYFFAKKLAAEKNCTVGVIGCNWGGTSASAWISNEYLMSDKDTRSYCDEYNSAMYGKTFEEYCRELTDYREWEAEWNPKIEEYYSMHPHDGSWDEAQEYAGGLSRYPEPLGPKSPFRPSGLYKTMLERVMPYSLAGFLYYQGESDDHKPLTYYKLLKMLIKQWRDDWNDDTLPFLFVQLPMFLNAGEEDHKRWCFIREAQLKVHLEDKNTGLAVILDKGEFNNIHPLDKKTVGERLFLQAMHHVYGTLPADDAYGPVFREASAENGGMLLRFDHGEGICSASEKLTGFEIAGTDKTYFNAKAEIRGDSVFIRSDDVKKPVYARYAWFNWGDISLFGKNGIPASPFRTSEDDGSSFIGY